MQLSPSDQALILKAKAAELNRKRTLRNNIEACKLIGNALRTSLGPRGMEKMFVDQFDVVVTTDGREILKRLESAHPVGKIIYETVKFIDVSTG